MRALRPEEIDYMDAGMFTMGCGPLRQAICKAFAKIPAAAVENVMDNCIMLMPMIVAEKGFYIPRELIRDKDLILLSEALLELEWGTIENTILHEAAHCALRHKSPVQVIDLDWEAQEREADALVNQWLTT